MRERVGRIPAVQRPQFVTRHLESMIAALAARQHGVISLGQLVGLGLSPRAVRHRVAGGRLHRLHRGVYAVGHPVVSAKGRWMAAVLACGEGAVLSHRSAGAHRGVRPSARRATDVTVPGRGGRSRPGIDIHRCALHPDDVTLVDGIPCTSVARTLLDLAETIDRRGVARAIDQAEILRVYDHKAVEDVLARAHGRHGAGLLSAVVKDLAEPALTRSELENRFLTLCDHAGVPRPARNAWMELDDGGPDIEVDFLWREQRLAVEMDGYETHGTRQAFERDRERDRRLTLAGYRPVRWTWRQVTRRPNDVEAAVRALLR